MCVLCIQCNPVFNWLKLDKKNLFPQALFTQILYLVLKLKLGKIFTLCHELFLNVGSQVCNSVRIILKSASCYGEFFHIYIVEIRFFINTMHLQCIYSVKILQICVLESEKKLNTCIHYKEYINNMG